ncbi:PLP-dependent aminotransferase family protein [Amycolatopsis sp. K13G38]|uniref:PLP-dependent aminotransferase family protein n=1 Tax=Amycolatopsis acididurans TaxID=2724524 RepID=A0ABX1J1S6_9PSEU|nr:PLP-dependent aminotransferase family protein [Amycolatopsis acididurans]NKQ52216.1 PLP-dependent aminotransferase family protein [Amycolatopsis acididurans]
MTMTHEPVARVTTLWLAGRIGERSARGIALTLADLIRDGEVRPGSRLPSVRELAAGLSVSATTVAEAWSALRAEALVGTQGRRGTIVLAPPPDTGPRRGFPAWSDIDLEQGLPDPVLLPPLAEAMAAAQGGSGRGSITPRLRAAVRPTWPFEPEAWTVVAGGRQGAVLGCQAVARPGDVVAIEEPTSPVLLDTLRNARVRVVPVPCDDEGPRPEALAAALGRQPVAFVYQPFAAVPCGHSGSAGRVARLAEVLASYPDTAVLEIDALGPLAARPPASVGVHLPGRALLIRSYCTAYGPELRSCVVAGAARLVERVRYLHGLEAAWTSRVLQDAQAFLIADPQTESVVRRARDRYAWRRSVLVDALRAEGFAVRARDGLLLWVPVPDETRTLVTLAGRGVSAGPGSGCFATPPRKHHVRIATGQLPDEGDRIADLAALVADAAGASGAARR